MEKLIEEGAAAAAAVSKSEPGSFLNIFTILYLFLLLYCLSRVNLMHSASLIIKGNSEFMDSGKR